MNLKRLIKILLLIATVCSALLLTSCRYTTIFDFLVSDTERIVGHDEDFYVKEYDSHGETCYGITGLTAKAMGKTELTIPQSVTIDGETYVIDRFTGETIFGTAHKVETLIWDTSLKPYSEFVNQRVSIKNLIMTEKSDYTGLTDHNGVIMRWHTIENIYFEDGDAIKYFQNNHFERMDEINLYFKNADGSYQLLGDHVDNEAELNIFQKIGNIVKYVNPILAIFVVLISFRNVRKTKKLYKTNRSDIIALKEAREINVKVLVLISLYFLLRLVGKYLNMLDTAYFYGTNNFVTIALFSYKFYDEIRYKKYNGSKLLSFFALLSLIIPAYYFLLNVNGDMIFPIILTSILYIYAIYHYDYFDSIRGLVIIVIGAIATLSLPVWIDIGWIWLSFFLSEIGVIGIIIGSVVIVLAGIGTRKIIIEIYD